MALIDTGAQVSLIARAALHPRSKPRNNELFKTSWITGNIMDIGGEVDIDVGPRLSEPEPRGCSRR